MVAECARAGVKFLRKLIINEDKQEEHLEDRRRNLENIAEQSTEDEHKSLDVLSYVKNIVFTVKKEDMSPFYIEKLQNQYPEVIVIAYLMKLGENEEGTISEIERARGGKRMVIELDETEIAREPPLRNKLRKQFPPWAIIGSGEDPMTSRKISNW